MYSNDLPNEKMERYVKDYLIPLVVDIDVQL